jgi:uncharacterized repeat protein (TIGR03843 family)
LLEEKEGHDRLWLIDHGICFHTEHKLRTVIWEFAGEPLPSELLANLEKFSDKLATNEASLRTELQSLLSQIELEALQKRIRRVLNQRRFLSPGPGRPYPWPPV